MLRNGSHNPRLLYCLYERCSEYAHIQAPANLEEQALTLCGKDIYQKLIKGYTDEDYGIPNARNENRNTRQYIR